jgi:hypothetical protein
MKGSIKKPLNNQTNMENENQNLEVSEVASGTEVQVFSADQLGNLLEASTGLEKKKTSVNVSPEYFEFAKVGTKVRGLLFGVMSINVKDKKTDELREIDAVAWVADKKVYLNAGVNLVSQLKRLNLPKGTAVEIEFTEKDGDVKKYSVTLLQ